MIEYPRSEIKERPEPLCRAYHWTTSAKVAEIIGNQQGLKPLTFINPDSSDNSQEPIGPYSFCLINSPYPPEWQRYEFLFKFMLFTIEYKGGSELALISFDVFPDDMPEVLDYEKTTGKTYTSTRIPFRNYQGSYMLPELILPTVIPHDRIAVEPLPDFVEGMRSSLKQYLSLQPQKW